MKTPVYRGAVIEESLETLDALGSLKTLGISETGDRNPAERCRIVTVEGSREQVRALSRSMKLFGWHAQFWDGDRNTMVVFRGRVFEFRRDDHRAWGDVARHAEAVGVPPERLGSPVG